MNRTKRARVFGWMMAGTLAAALPALAQARGDDRGKGRWVRVTVTNITQGQVLSPFAVATHSDDLTPIFALGTPASTELAGVAEDADIPGMVAALTADPAVHDVVVLSSGDPDFPPIKPGETFSVEVQTSGRFRELSMVGMLVTTNDAFTGLSGVRISGKDPIAMRTVAYDAGSEVNNELCEYIPGPPCGNGGVRSQEGAEGYVHVHAGVRGVGDLPEPAFPHWISLDWRNPVALVTIERLPRNHDR